MIFAFSFGSAALQTYSIHQEHERFQLPGCLYIESAFYPLSHPSVHESMNSVLVLVLVLVLALSFIAASMFLP